MEVNQINNRMRADMAARFTAPTVIDMIGVLGARDGIALATYLDQHKDITGAEIWAILDLCREQLTPPWVA